VAILSLTAAQEAEEEERKVYRSKITWLGSELKNDDEVPAAREGSTILNIKEHKQDQQEEEELVSERRQLEISLPPDETAPGVWETAGDASSATGGLSKEDIKVPSVATNRYFGTSSLQ
jgi:hypothetical protein